MMYIHRLGERLAHRRVAKCVLMDVQMGNMRAGLATLHQPVALGLLYQYRQIVAWLLADLWPSLANSLASGSAASMRGMAVQGAAKEHKALCKGKNADTLALSGYPYYYWQRNFYLSLLGLARGRYDLTWFERDTTTAPPVLLVFGARKPFAFHSRSIEKKLNNGTVGGRGSKSVGLPCGHWVQLEQAVSLTCGACFARSCFLRCSFHPVPFRSVAPGQARCAKVVCEWLEETSASGGGGKGVMGAVNVGGGGRSRM